MLHCATLASDPSAVATRPCGAGLQALPFLFCPHGPESDKRKLAECGATKSGSKLRLRVARKGHFFRAKSRKKPRMLPAMETGNLMSQASKREYLKRIYPRYQKADATAKQRILDEFCANCRYHRKHAIRLLNGPPPAEKRRSKRRKKERRSRRRLLQIRLRRLLQRRRRSYRPLKI